MKIAIIRKRYTPFGGAERYLQNLATSFLAHGHEVHLLASKWLGGEPGLIFHKVPIIPGNSFLEALSFAFSSARLVTNQSFDIVLSFERTLVQDVYRAGDGCHREWLRRRRFIIPFQKRLFESVSPLHRALLFLEKKTFRNSKFIVANSRQVKDEILKHYQIDDYKIRVIYNRVDLEKFKPENRSRFRVNTRQELHVQDQELLILFVGSGFERKGLEFLIRAIAKAGKDHTGSVPIKLLVAGKGDVDKYHLLAKEERIAERIIFLGPSDRTVELYAASDLFVLPTIYDPCSNACLEAMAAGVPVITSRANGASEMIVDGENGYVIGEVPDVRSIAAAIVNFIKGAQKEEMQWKARVSVETLVNTTDEVTIYNSIFSDIKKVII